MPIYEFACERCGCRFEGLVQAGTASVACRNCRAAGARRVYSAPGAPFKLVKSPGQTRRQERQNAKLRERAKQGLADARRRSRQPQGGGM
jgi:putative FmdB family regulatory protein